MRRDWHIPRTSGKPKPAGRASGGAASARSNSPIARGKAPPGRSGRAATPDRGRWLYGRHAVTAALANPERRWRRLAVLVGQEAEGERLLAAAVAPRRGGEGRVLEVLARDAFGALLPSGAVHQGLAIEVEPLPEPDLGDLLRELETAAGRSVVVVLDQVGDPQNIGAVLRSAAAFDARAVLVASHGAPPVTGALAKAASGAVERVPLIRVVNIARALARLKDAGFWACGLEAAAETPFAALDLGLRIALVLGSEGGGIRRLVREQCDYVARLPTTAAQPTLNISNAAAVALYELARRQ